MKIAALGRSQILYDSIKIAVNAGHEVCFIVTCADAPEYHIRQEDFRSLATDLNVPYLCTEKIDCPEVLDLIATTAPSTAISVNWKTLIPKSFLDLFPQSILNAHAGDLPRFRGNATPNWAILAGEHQVALCIHQMSAELDAGKVLLKRFFPLTSDTYVGDIYTFIEQNAPDMFLEALDTLERGCLIGKNQSTDPSRALRCFPRIPSDSEIHWDQPADNICRLIRASAEPFSGAYSFLEGKRIIIWRARVETLPYSYLGIPGQVVERRTTDKEVAILTAHGVLILECVELDQQGPQPPTKVIKSTRTRLGLNYSIELERLSAEIQNIQNQIKVDHNATKETV